jgi:hypothetical protein
MWTSYPTDIRQNPRLKKHEGPKNKTRSTKGPSGECDASTWKFASPLAYAKSSETLEKERTDIPRTRCPASSPSSRGVTRSCFGTVIEPLKLIPYYCLNHSTWPLCNNIEVTCHLCRVKPGKSLTLQDRQLYIKTHMKASPKINKSQIVTNQCFNIKVNGSKFETQRKSTKWHKQHHTTPSVMPLSTVILPLVLPTGWERTRPRKAIITHIITRKTSTKARLSILTLSNT